MDKVYWDSCTWLAYLGRERVEKPRGLPENRYRACLDVIKATKLGKCEIVSSVFSTIEVSRGSSEEGMSLDSFEEAFERDYAVLEPMYASDGRNVRDLMTVGYAGLKPTDAIHLAAAIEIEVSEFHTYDRKLLNLNGKVPQKSGGYLRICKPDAGELHS